MSDTTDLMGVADASVDTSAPAAGTAAPKRRRSGTGLEGMVLAELQQVASGLGIRGTARMRKSQLIEVIKEAQAGGGSAAKPAADAAEAKPKRRATSKARTGETAEAPAAEKPAVPAQIEIPGQPASGDAPAGERRRRRATAPSGSPETAAAATTVVTAEPKAEPKTEAAPAAQPEAKADTKAEAAVSAPE
ncbi:Rho termination factor N-terminal domain-containing protein, partial [Streptomyces bambusae]